MEKGHLLLRRVNTSRDTIGDSSLSSWREDISFCDASTRRATTSSRASSAPSIECSLRWPSLLWSATSASAKRSRAQRTHSCGAIVSKSRLPSRRNIASATVSHASSSEPRAAGAIGRCTPSITTSLPKCRVVCKRRSLLNHTTSNHRRISATEGIATRASERELNKAE